MNVNRNITIIDTNLLFKEVGYDLGTLLGSIDLGVIGLPEIQRPFVWKNAKCRDLFDSMYRRVIPSVIFYYGRTRILTDQKVLV